MPSLDVDPYAAAKKLDIYKEIPAHPYKEVNAETIVDRIMKSRAMYEERQRAKGVKGLGEEGIKRRETMEQEAKSKRMELSRRYTEVERGFGI